MYSQHATVISVRLVMTSSVESDWSTAYIALYLTAITTTYPGGPEYSMGRLHTYLGNTAQATYFRIQFLYNTTQGSYRG